MDLQVPAHHWNLFAWELETILQAQQPPCSLSLLDDRAGLHREKVRRLQQSLTQATPKHLPVLNPEELEEVVERFGLTREEAQRLHAALLVTAIERLLLDRLEPEVALQLAEHLLPSITTALIQLPSGVFRKGAERMAKDTWLDEALEDALEAIDRATLAWQLSYRVEAPLERVGQLRQACDCFRQGLRLLAEANPAVQQTATWQVWQQEASRGLEQTSQRLATLEDI